MSLLDQWERSPPENRRGVRPWWERLRKDDDKLMGDVDSIIDKAQRDGVGISTTHRWLLQHGGLTTKQIGGRAAFSEYWKLRERARQTS